MSTVTIPADIARRIAELEAFAQRPGVPGDEQFAAMLAADALREEWASR